MLALHKILAKLSSTRILPSVAKMNDEKTGKSTGWKESVEKKIKKRTKEKTERSCNATLKKNETGKQKDFEEDNKVMELNSPERLYINTKPYKMLQVAFRPTTFFKIFVHYCFISLMLVT